MFQKIKENKIKLNKNMRNVRVMGLKNQSGSRSANRRVQLSKSKQGKER